MVQRPKTSKCPSNSGLHTTRPRPFTFHPATERLHAWHILPLGAYFKDEDALLAEGPDGGLVERFGETLNFRLLKGIQTPVLFCISTAPAAPWPAGGGPIATARYTVPTLSTHTSWP